MMGLTFPEPNLGRSLCPLFRQWCLSPQPESPDFLPLVRTAGSQSQEQPKDGDRWLAQVVNNRASSRTLTTPAGEVGDVNGFSDTPEEHLGFL